MKGLELLPKLCLSRIMIENGKLNPFDQKGYIDLYTDKEWEDTLGPAKPLGTEESQPKGLNKIKVSFDLCLKGLYPASIDPKSGNNNPIDINIANDLISLLQQMEILGYRIQDPKIIQNLLISSDKTQYIKENIIGSGAGSGPLAPVEMILWKGPGPVGKNITDYISYEENTAILHIPVNTGADFYEYDRADFLAYFFVPTLNGEPMGNTWASEIVFMDGKIPTENIWLWII